MTLHIGKIVGLRGSWGSDLAALELEDNIVYCDNAPTVRAFEDCFGDVIGEGHTIDNEDGGHVGQEFIYSVDAMGMLEGFTPSEEAPPEMLQILEEQEGDNG